MTRVSRPDLTDAAWRKSSYSNQEGRLRGSGGRIPGVVPIRDSKAVHGPALSFAAPSWTSFIAELKKDRRFHPVG